MEKIIKKLIVSGELFDLTELSDLTDYDFIRRYISRAHARYAATKNESYASDCAKELSENIRKNYLLKEIGI